MALVLGQTKMTTHHETNADVWAHSAETSQLATLPTRLDRHVVLIYPDPDNSCTSTTNRTNSADFCMGATMKLLGKGRRPAPVARIEDSIPERLANYMSER